MVVICVTGTPGTGKTYLAKRIATKLKLKYIKVPFSEAELEYDIIRDCDVIGKKELRKQLICAAKQRDIIIDSHMSQYLPAKYADLCIVTKCKLKTLKKRLIKRGYSKEKVRGNLDAEIFDNCLTEAVENAHNVMVFETGAKSNISEVLKEIEKCKLKNRS